MSRFRMPKHREAPALNMASLPDMIFTILFFFMIVTNMRPVPVKTQLTLPTVAEWQKLEEKSLIIYIMVGKDPQTVQLNSDFVALDQLPQGLQTIRQAHAPEEQAQLMAVLKIDKDTPMRYVTQIKQDLREAGVLTVHYSADKSKTE